MAKAICMAGRVIPDSYRLPDRLSHDTAILLEKIVERPDGPPLLLVSNRLKGYGDGCDNMKAEPQSAAMYVPAAPVDNRRANNNWHERHNGYFERRKNPFAR